MMKKVQKKCLNFLVFLCVMGIVSLALGTTGTQAAGERRLLSRHDNWDAYITEDKGQKVCFMSSQPQKSEGKYTRRGQVFALITHRPDEGSKDVFSMIAGYPYKTGSDVSLKIDSKRFDLFTQDETAWARDTSTDSQITSAVQKGSKMVVQGTSKRGTLTTDTFSLRGSGAAYKAITQACGS